MVSLISEFVIGGDKVGCGGERSGLSGGSGWDGGRKVCGGRVDGVFEMCVLDWWRDGDSELSWDVSSIEACLCGNQIRFPMAQVQWCSVF